MGPGRGWIMSGFRDSSGYCFDERDGVCSNLAPLRVEHFCPEVLEEVNSYDCLDFTL